MGNRNREKPKDEPEVTETEVIKTTESETRAGDAGVGSSGTESIEDEKDNVVAEAIDNAESGPAETSIQLTPDRITTEAEAIAHIKANYEVPLKCRVVLVTEDKNVFWEENAGSAVNHAQKQNLKLFRLSCQALVK